MRDAGEKVKDGRREESVKAGPLKSSNESLITASNGGQSLHPCFDEDERWSEQKEKVA